MHPRLVGSRLAILLVVTLCLAHAPPVVAQGTARAPGPAAFTLAPQLARLFDVNRVSCPIEATGEICGSRFDHSTSDRANWPKGTANRHVGASGLRLAGVVAAGGGPWAGDTSAAAFHELRGIGPHGEPVEPIYAAYSSAAEWPYDDGDDDSADWPAAAGVPATGAGSELFAPSLRGRVSASDGDAWFLTWDGNPAYGGGRPHPLGVMVETRVMGWRGPQWNNDIIYVTYTIYNVTASDPAVYAGIRPELRDIAEAQGVRFQQLNEAEFGVALPDAGYTIERFYAGMVQDPEILSEDNVSVAFPLATSLAWQATFGTEGAPWLWELRPELHSPPFLPAPGFTGMAVLDAPAGGAELQFFSGHTGSSTGFPPPSTAAGVMRHMAGAPDPVLDGTCNQPAPVASRVCWLPTVGNNAQYMMSTPPAALAPGEARTLVVAFVFAAPVAVPSFTPGALTNVPPGNPLELGSAAAMIDGVNLVDSIAGYRGFTDRDGDGVVAAGEMDLVPGSYYGKVRIAQVLFANGFISPQTPEAPDFHLIPGDDRVTVIWRQSVSEQTGDPFFSVARDAVLLDGSPNPLYDPNYREFDVEGYRVYRGRTDRPDEMELVAQFDYSGTSITDYAGQIHPRTRCAPELGVTDDCPIEFDPVASGVARTAGVQHPLVGSLPQVRIGDRYRTEGGLVLAATTDSLTGPGLQDNGVPFAWIDDQVRNNFRYFYAVTAFDVNSWQSGPASAESAILPKAVTPRRPASNARYASQPVTELLAADGTVLDPRETGWDIDAETGRFNGPPPPTNAFSTLIEGFVAELAPAISLEVRLDSVVAYLSLTPECGNGAISNGLGSCYVFYVTFDRDGEISTAQVPTPWPVWSSFDGVSRINEQLGSVPLEADQNQLARYGIPLEGFRAATAGIGVQLSQYIDFSSFEGQGARRDRFGDGAGLSVGGSRWFTGTQENVAHPTYGIRVGHIGGVDTIWSPIHHTDILPGTGAVEVYANSNAMQCFGYGFAGLSRMADMRVTWGAGGSIASIEDVTHSLPMQFSPNAAASYGFVTDANANGVIEWTDFDLIPNVQPYTDDLGFCNVQAVAPAPLVDQPVFGPTSTEDLTTGFTATGNGFGIYINGERFIFELSGGKPPAEGTVWTLRSYTGRVSANFDEETTEPDGYLYVMPLGGARSAAVAGLRVRVTIPRPPDLVEVTSDSLRRVHTVPDPFYLTGGFDAGTGERAIKFVNLPHRAILRIYSLSGVLVDIIEHNDASLGGTADWDLRNRDGTPIAPGVYFYHIESGSARAVGKFTVVTYQP